MGVNFSMVGVLFRNELRMLLRDKRSVMTSIILPLLLMPIMLFSSTWTNKKRVETLRTMTYEYAVEGSRAEAARTLLTSTREHLSEEQKTNAKAAFNFKEVQIPNPFKALTNREIHLLVEGLSAEEAVAESTNRVGILERGIGGNGAPLVRISYRGDRDDAGAAAQRLSDALHKTRELQRADLLAARGLPFPARNAAVVSVTDLASQGHVAGLRLGRMLSLLVLFFMMIAGSVAATDLIAGEKERGTLETLLTSAANRVEIVVAKQLVIFTVAATITLIQAGNLLVYVGFKLIPVPAGFSTAVPPSVALLLLILFLPVAGLVAGTLLLISGYAKSYKEAQLYFTPVFLVGLLPALAPLLPGLSLRSAIVFVPVANIALATKEILTGVIDWPALALAWLVTMAAAAWTMRLSVRFLSAERLVTAAEMDRVEFSGGPALFGRRVLSWFAVLWALLLIVGNNTAQSDLRLQIFLNVVVLFGGASLLMARRYQLRAREAFAWRAPKPAAWFAVLAATPCGILAGTGLFRLADLVFPVPPQMLESFTQALLPGQIPFWQILFFLAVLPGIMEELTFRGALLHGLHNRLHPAALVLVVGLIFGLFHAALFRLAPTAFLGVLLSLVTLLTGSIFPAMLWHALSNALALLAGHSQLPISDLHPAWYGFGVAGLLATFWILWRNRTPYPGLRPWRKRKH
jgi:membrane protease YdiL (CAAX protease family)